MQLDLFPEMEESEQEEEIQEPTLEELEEIHGVFPGSPGWTHEMEEKRLKMIREIDRHAHALLRFNDGHHERVPFYGHSFIQGVRLLHHGNVFTIEKLRELKVNLIVIEASQRKTCINPIGCKCAYQHVSKLEDIQTDLPELDLNNI